MRKVLFFVLTIISLNVFSQAPKLINYQGVARNSSGVALANTQCTLTIDITSGTYIEKHVVTSNAVGIFTLKIGGGAVLSGSFASINWGGALNTINVTIDAGSGPQTLGPQQLVSVPYALYAETAGTSSGTGSIPKFSINPPNTVSSNTTTNTHTINVVPPTATFSAGILTLNPGGDTTNLGSLVGPWSKAGSSVYLNVTNDNVGIGLSSPSAKLQVAATSSIGNIVSIIDPGVNLGDALQIQKFGASGRGAFINMGSTTTGTAVTITSTGNGPGMYIDVNSSDNGIHARSTGTPATILGDNFNGSGPSVHGLKSSTFGGNAGLFNITVPSSSDALVGSTVGSGAGVRAISGPAATSTVALWVDNGHIKSSSSAAPSISTVSVSGGGISAITFTCNQCTDVKGSMLAVITTSTMVNPGNNATLKITFNKNYSVIPTVIITPAADFGQLNYFVSAVTPNSFNITVRNPTTLSVNTPASMPVHFNYFVIE